MLNNRCKLSRRLQLAVFFLLVSGESTSADETGVGFEALRLRDFEAASSAFLVRAASGDQQALYHLAGLYRRGLGVPEDRDKANEIYRQLAEKGHAAATLGHAWTFQ